MIIYNQEKKIIPYLIENLLFEIFEKDLDNGVDILNKSQLKKIHELLQDIEKYKMTFTNPELYQNILKLLTESIVTSFKDSFAAIHKIKDLNQEQICQIVELDVIKTKNLLIFSEALDMDVMDSLLGRHIIRDCIILNLSLFNSPFKTLSYCSKIIDSLPTNLCKPKSQTISEFKKLFNDMQRFENHSNPSSKNSLENKRLKEKIADLQNKYDI